MEKEDAKIAVLAGGVADNGGKKRNVLIVSVLLPIIIDLALRSKTQRRIDVLQMPLLSAGDWALERAIFAPRCGVAQSRVAVTLRSPLLPKLFPKHICRLIERPSTSARR